MNKIGKNNEKIFFDLTKLIKTDASGEFFLRLQTCCVQTNKCTAIHFLSKFWMVFDTSNSKPWLLIVQNHIWNIIEDIANVADK